MHLLPPPASRLLDRAWSAAARLALARLVRRSPLPDDVAALRVDGPDPLRILVVGDLAARGLGVLLPGMAFPAQLAEAVSRRTGRGARGTVVADPALTLRAAAAHPALDARERRDVAVVALGVPDALRGTTRRAAVRQVERLVARVRASAGDDCAVVLAGLPPMARFQPLPAFASALLARRAAELDGALDHVASRTSGVAYAPFPDWDTRRLHVRDAFSYRALHHLWADAVAPAVQAALAAPRAAGAAAVVAPVHRVVATAVATATGAGGPTTRASGSAHVLVA